MGEKMLAKEMSTNEIVKLHNHPTQTHSQIEFFELEVTQEFITTNLVFPNHDHSFW